jgi:simple sugar transport system permease protein
MVMAMALAMPFAVASLTFAADQIVTGTGINLLALGVTGMAYKLTPLEWQARTVVGIDPSRLMVVTAILIAATGAMLRFTRLGLTLRAIGESPQAARAAGIAVQRHRWLAILFGAACAGLAGSYLSIMYSRAFTENMTDGIGFLALAMVIFGRWRASGILLAGLFFGIVQAVADHVETRSGLPPAVLRLFAALPYLVSLAALAGVAGKSGAPDALGKPFVTS